VTGDTFGGWDLGMAWDKVVGDRLGIALRFENRLGIVDSEWG